MLRQSTHNLFKTKVSGGVLQLALGIGIIISMILASVISLVYYSRLSFLSKQIDDKLTSNALSGIQVVMASRSDLGFYEKSSIDLFGDETDSVEISRKPWGIFELACTRAYQGSKTIWKTALISPLPDSVGISAIYTPDDNTPLYLVGNTRIRGDVYMSARKMSTGYIDGKGYVGKKLFEGTAHKSKTVMPSYDGTLLTEIKSILDHKSTAYPLQQVDLQRLPPFFSFQSDKVNYYYSKQALEISDSLKGNVVIHSELKVRVTSSARLRDVIIIAPEISFDNQVHGSVQCFASRYIEIGKDCRLHYPSALVLMGGEQDSTIVLKENARVEGVIVIPGLDQVTSSGGSLKVERGAIFHGMAYVNASADIQGGIFGHIMTRRFQATVGSVPYGNHLLDAEIDARKRSSVMPGSFGWGNSTSIAIAKWLE